MPKEKEEEEDENLSEEELTALKFARTALRNLRAVRSKPFRRAFKRVFEDFDSQLEDAVNSMDEDMFPESEDEDEERAEDESQSPYQKAPPGGRSFAARKEAIAKSFTGEILLPYAKKRGIVHVRG